MICAQMTAAFLAFSAERGNDLSTPQPEAGFPGLKPGDRWCLCAGRWREALDAGVAPPVVLSATHEEALAVVTLDDLEASRGRFELARASRRVSAAGNSRPGLQRGVARSPQRRGGNADRRRFGRAPNCGLAASGVFDQLERGSESGFELAIAPATASCGALSTSICGSVP